MLATNIAITAATETRWYLRALLAPICELSAHQDPRSLSIVFDICQVRLTIWMAVVRILLDPTACLWISVINVVPVCHLQAAAKVRSFLTKARIFPIFVVAECFGDLHCV